MENTNQMLKNRTTCVYGFEKEPTSMLVLLLLMCFMISQPMKVEFVYHMSYGGWGLGSLDVFVFLFRMKGAHYTQL